MASIRAMGDFLGGRFVVPSAPTGVIEKTSPADLDDRVGAFPVQRDHVAQAVDAARRAFAGWRATPLQERVAVLKTFGQKLLDREATLVEALGREVGKPSWEAKTEVRALAAKIEITVSEGLELVKGFSLDGGKLACRFEPHGVLAVLGPFNFPLHLPNGHLVPALATGNTVVFKPSEVAPWCAQLYAEAARDAGFPPGVVNVVQGGGPEGELLAGHDGVDGVLFTGSYAVGVQILRANAHRPGRMLALELGGKNTAVVLADAPLEKTLYDVLFSAIVTAGQRCTAVSRVVVERPILDRVVDGLVQRAGDFAVGPPASPGAFYGPLSTAAGYEKFHAAQAEASRGGAEVLLPSRPVEGLPKGYYVRPSIHRVLRPDAASRYQNEEIFGPDLAVYAAEDLEEACQIANGTRYGLAAGVFTADRAKLEACASRLKTGCLTWNAPTVGSSSRLPFGGVKNSGNHRPAALFSTRYCTYPVALMQGDSALDPSELPPGVRWTPGRV